MLNNEKDLKLHDKVVLITGASEGIGREIAYTLAQEGACLALAARTGDKLAFVAQDIRWHGNKVLDIPTDVTNSQQANLLILEAIKTYGRIDILVNNVGRGLRKPFVDTTDEDWAQLVATNLSSVMFMCRAVLPYMEREGSGLIINIASRSARVGEANLAAYCAVKHGVIGLTRALAVEFGPKGIRVNAICPAAVKTERMEKLLPQVDKSGWLAPADVAAAVLLLVTSPGHTMQGQALDMF